MEDIIEYNEVLENDHETNAEQDKFLDESWVLEQSKLHQNFNIIDDDKQGIDIAEFLLKNLQQNQNNISMDAMLNDSSG